MFLINLMHGMVAPARLHALQPSGRVTITSEPSGLAVYADGRLIGQTPLENYALSIGSHNIRVERPKGVTWDVLDWQWDGAVSDKETIRAHAVFTGPVILISNPFDAEVYMNGHPMGTTPLRLSNLAPGRYAVSLRKRGYEDVSRSFVVKDTAHQTLEVDLAPDNPGIVPLSGYSASVRKDHRVKNTLGYATLGLGILFTGLALNSDRKADQAYGRYLNTADPNRSEQFFRQAARQDKRTSGFAVAAQINFAGAFYFLVSRAFRSKD